MNIILGGYDVQMVPGHESDLNFLTFIFELRKTPEKHLNQEIDPIGIEPGPAQWEATTLSLDHSAGINAKVG